MSFGTILFIVFLVLKLTHTIDWSWWWVTSPLWIGGAIVLVTFIIAGGFLALVAKLTDFR